MVVVAIAEQKRYDYEEVKTKLEKILIDSGMINIVEGKLVLIKPNCTGVYTPEEGRTTHPIIIGVLIDILTSVCAKVILGESSSVGVNTLEAYHSTGIYNIAKKKDIEIIDFKKSKYETVWFDGLILDNIQLPEEVLRADYIISAAKMKTNYVSGISCSIKNLKGFLRDEDKKKFHRIGLGKAVADLSKAIPNTLGVIDGIVGSELYEPTTCGALIASKNLLACDVVCSKLMGIDPKEVEHLSLMMDKLDDLQIAGDNISRFIKKFKTCNNDESSIEKDFCVKIKNNGCSSCLGALYLSLKKAREKDPKLIEGLEITIGQTEEERIGGLLFGNCSVEGIDKNSEKFVVYGCPPTTSEFIVELKRFKKHQNFP